MMDSSGTEVGLRPRVDEDEDEGGRVVGGALLGRRSSACRYAEVFVVAAS